MKLIRKFLYSATRKNEGKMKMGNITYPAFFLILILSLFLMGSGGPRFPLIPKNLAKQLNLSKRQQEGYKDLFWEYTREAKRLFPDIIKMTIELQKELNAKSIEKSDVRMILKNIASKEAEFRLAEITLITEFCTFLTPKERDQFKAMIGKEYNLPRWNPPELSELFSGSSKKTCKDWCGNKWKDCRAASYCKSEDSYCSYFCGRAERICSYECDRQY